MKIWELILLISFLAVVIDYYRNRKLGFGTWLFGRGFWTYMLKAGTIFTILVLGIIRIDWCWLGEFLNFKLW